MKIRLRYVCNRCEGNKNTENNGVSDVCPTCFGKGYTEETIPKVTEMEVIND